MIEINPHAFLRFVSTAIIMGTGIFVLMFKHHLRMARYFFAFAVVSSLWQLSQALSYQLEGSLSYDELYFLAKLSYVGIIFIGPMLYLYLIDQFSLNKFHKNCIIHLSIATLFLILLFSTDWIVQGAIKYYWGYYPFAGILHPIYLIWATILYVQIIQLFLHLLNTHSSPKSQIQLKYLLVAYILYLFAAIDYSHNYGFEFYPIGFIFSSSFFILFSYIIFRYDFLNINNFIRKSILYTILIIFLSIVYFIAIFIIESFSKGLLGYHSFTTSIFVAILSTLLIFPLHSRIQRFIDRTFFKGSQLEIYQQNEYLRKEVAEADKNKAVAELASGIAHEIKNPITTLRTFYEYLPDKMEDKEFLHKMQKLSQSEFERIEHLIAQLLDFAKPQQPQFVLTNPVKLIKDTLELTESKAKKNNIDVVTDFRAKDTQINLDPQQIKQALLNLILNATDAMPKGGALTLKTHQNNKYYCIEISDTGCGINEKDLEHIFTPFHSSKNSGAGLGLSITKSIVENHNGKLSVQSRINQGTTFIIRIKS